MSDAGPAVVCVTLLLFGVCFVGLMGFLAKETEKKQAYEDSLHRVEVLCHDSTVECETKMKEYCPNGWARHYFDRQERGYETTGWRMVAHCE